MTNRFTKGKARFGAVVINDDVTVHGDATLQDVTAQGDTILEDVTVNGTTIVEDVTVNGVTNLGTVSVADATLTGNVTLPTTAGKGVKRGADFGWVDLIGAIQPKTTGAGTPALGAWRGGTVRTFFFQANDKIDFVYHMPHDWVPGTDLYIHVHWGHHGTNISGSFVFDFYTTFARGFNQSSNGNFVTEKKTTLTVDSLSISNTPQYRHRTDEVQLTTVGGAADKLDTSALEVDGLLLMTGVMTTIPTITGGATNLPSIFTIDIHYQSISAGSTKNRRPDFYA